MWLQSLFLALLPSSSLPLWSRLRATLSRLPSSQPDEPSTPLQTVALVLA